MPRLVRCGLIQAHCEWSPEKFSLVDIKKKMIAKHERLMADAAKRKVQILGLQELFYGPYFCAEQQTRWYELTERIPGLNGAEIVYNPSATVAGLSEYLWELEQPAHAVANAYFIAAINRVGTEHPWKIGEFYGKSYFCNPRGKIIAQAGRDKDELLVADLNFDEIEEVRNVWQFYRDRRPESYSEITRTRTARRAEAAN